MRSLAAVSFMSLVMTAILCAAPAARAADNMIVIKNPDGTVTNYEIPKEAVSRPVILKRAEPVPQRSLHMRRPPAADGEKAQAAPPEKHAAVPVPPAPPPHPSAPAPGRKPLRARETAGAASEMAMEGYAIPRREAIAIAIRQAPPADDFSVEKRTHDGIPVYAVTFSTEEGSSVVLVDARNGDVIMSGGQGR